MLIKQIPREERNLTSVIHQNIVFLKSSLSFYKNAMCVMPKYSSTKYDKIRLSYFGGKYLHAYFISVVSVAMFADTQLAGRGEGVDFFLFFFMTSQRKSAEVWPNFHQ